MHESVRGTQLRVGPCAGAGPFLRAKRGRGGDTGGAFFPSTHDPYLPSAAGPSRDAQFHTIWKLLLWLAH